MKIIVIGTRGIPNILGGVETHCEELYPRIAAKGHKVVVCRRSCYIAPENKIKEYKGVILKDLYAPRLKCIEALVHSFLAVLYARLHNPDIIHVHAIGPSLVIPFARLLGMKVVSTNHGPDYARQKWGKLAKCMLKMGEYLGVKYSNRIIVISSLINDIIKEKYNRHDSHVIFNGVSPVEKTKNTDYIDSLGLQSKKYIVGVGRFVKEKGFDLLIKAFSIIDNCGYRLVIVGDADHEDSYSKDLKELARRENVLLTGFIKGEKMNQIMTNAAFFVLPSFHEGLPISLLEAMNYKLDVVVSDIPANKLPELNAKDFFEIGNIKSLADILASKIKNHVKNREYDLSNYNWDYISEQVIKVYRF